MTKTTRSLVLGAVVALTTAVALSAPAGAESYDTTDEEIVVETSSGGNTVAPGGAVDVSSTGWDDNSLVNGYLHSDPIFLGTLTADSVGAVTGSFTIPADAPAGDHHIELSGTDPSGNARVLSYAIEVAAAGGDTAPDSLAFSGSTVVPLAGIGALAAAAGVSAMRFRRRRLGIA